MKRVDSSSRNTLSIRISTDGFCFCTYTDGLPDTLRYHHHDADADMSPAANFSAAWQECPFSVNKKYDEVRAIIVTDKFTVVPDEYDNKENRTAFFDSCFPDISDTSEILANRLTAHGRTVLFPVYRVLYEQLREIGDVSFYTPASILPGYVARYPLSAKRYMLIYCHKGKSILLTMADGRLQQINALNFDDSHDFLFYMLSMWKEQGLSQEDDTLCLCGDKTIEEIMPFVKQFIRHCRRINSSEQFRPALLNNIKNIPFDLQALLLCE